jgi:high affinity sulfate transporter 1
VSNADATPALTARSRRTFTSFVPVTRWLPTYRWSSTLPADLLAGVAVAALLVPESMGYADVAGVPAQVALYAALGSVLAYAVFGRTSILVVGPASAVAAMSATIVRDLSGNVDPVVATAGIAIAAGLIAIVAGVARLGWIVNFISRPVLHAFVAGLSISIIIGQADSLVGVQTSGRSALAEARHTLRAIGEWHWLTVGIGVGSIAALLVLERLLPKVPAAVVVVVTAIVASIVFDFDGRGVGIVGDIPSGLPSVAIPSVSAIPWIELLGGGLALLLVGFSEGYASARAVADKTGEAIDADQELIGSGAANVAAGLFGGMAVSGSLSKSAAAQSAGARSQMTNLVAGVLILATLLFLAPALRDLPEPALAAIVIVAVLRPADPRRVLALWPVNRLDFAAGAITFTLVLVWETLPALVVGIALSLAFLVRRASFPDVVELRADDERVFRRVDEADLSVAHAPATRDVAVLRFEAPLIYANADRFRVAVGALCADHDGLQRVVVDAEMVSDLDATGAEMLEAVDDDLAERGIVLHLARVHARARHQMQRSGLARRFAGRLHPSLHEAAGVPES